jgi:putative DNA primase/helicase
LLFNLFQKYEKANKDDDKNLKELNEIKKFIYKLRNSTHRDAIIKDILVSISNVVDIKFDTKQHLFCFNNAIYNTNSGTFESPNYEDYISLTTGYDYDFNYTKKYTNELDSFINTIFPDTDLKSFYLSVLCSGLQGKNLEKFIVASGCGGNGKGVINELALECFGNYGYVLNNNVLLKPLKEGPNPEIASLHNKRFVISREPNSNYKINCSLMKDLTGGNQIKARALYSNESSVFLALTLILECNKKPALDEIDPAVERRLNEVEFKSKFVEKDVYDNLTDEDKKYTFLRNGYYKSTEFKEKYKQALFELLIMYYKDFKNNNFELIIPEQVRNKTTAYLMVSDDISEWINEIFEKTNNEKDIIKLKDIFKTFKESDFYSNFSKNDKRKYNYKYFTDAMCNNLFLKKLVNIRSDVYYLKHYKYKVDVNDINDDENIIIVDTPVDTPKKKQKNKKPNEFEINFDCFDDN